MQSDWDINNLYDLAQKNWHKPIGLFSSVAIVFVFETFILNSIEASIVSKIIVYTISILFVLFYWLYSNRIPKTNKGKVGFVVCIQCSNEEEQKVIKEDFIKTLRKLIKESSTGQSFHFIEIPQHKAEFINDISDAHILKSKTKSHFFIFGRVRLRLLGGKEYHVLELDGIVAHKPIKTELSAQISNEFAELFPRRLQISTENDLLSLNFTSEWAESVAKYIIGIAAACSSDLDYAEKLYRDVEKKLEGIKTDFPIFEKLKQRLPIRFSEIYITRSKAYLKAWRRNKDEKFFSLFVNNVEKISDILADSYDVLLLRSVEAFLDGRRIKDANEYLNKCTRFDDPVWHLNLAFIKAYENDLKGSIRQYRKGAKYNLAPETIDEIEDFIVWFLEEEPDKYQFYYCLGFFNWQIKGDLIQAVDDFKNFLNNIKQGEFEKEKQLAQEWTAQIQKLSASKNKN